VGRREWSFVSADAREAGTATRRSVRNFLSEEACERCDLDAAEIIVGELISNVILHAPGPIGMHCWWEGATAILIVADRGPGLPPVRPLPDPTATTGRGLLLIDALAKSVRFDCVPGRGTRIAVELPVCRRCSSDPRTAATAS
jgi:anti-sigma regulatory factor (Ser/Thr protein kinase)